MKTLSLNKPKTLSKSQIKKQKKKAADKKALIFKEEQSQTQILADEYLQSFEVISSGHLLTIGFARELRTIYSEFETFSFSKRQLITSLCNYCKSEPYKDQDSYGVRYNIDNIATHQIVRVTSE